MYLSGRITLSKINQITCFMQLGFNLSNGVSDNTLVQFNTDLFGDTQSIYTQFEGRDVILD
jgi:hypothetical protein